MVSFDMLDKIRSMSKETKEELDSWILSHENEATAFLDRMKASLMENPLLKRYIQDRSRVKEFKNTQPWHALGERLMAQLLVSEYKNPVITMPDEFSFRGTPRVSHIIQRAQMVAGLGLAQVYLWREHTRMIAHNSPVPRHTVSRDVLPHPFMFWSFESALPLASETGFESDWMYISDQGEGISIYGDATTERGAEELTSHINGGSIMYGSIFPDDMQGAIQQANGQILAHLAFINSPYVSKAKVGTPRALRRQFGEHYHDESEASVVVLRRGGKLVSQHASSEEGTERQWHHQWWVSGHIRAQWRPSTKSHKLIWISPYLKGPAGKPILPKVYDVTR